MDRHPCGRETTTADHPSNHCILCIFHETRRIGATRHDTADRQHPKAVHFNTTLQVRAVNLLERLMSVRINQADAFAEQLRSLIASIGQGASLRQIAAVLNARMIFTPRGKEWQAASVRNLLACLA